MNSKSTNILTKFISNLSYAVFSNFLVLIVSLLTSLVVPKVLGIEEYGYWQLYLFYSLFIGILHFGWCDGIYLRYGGSEYETLDKPIFKGQFYLLLFLQCLFSIIIFLVTLTQDLGNDRQFVLECIAFCLVATNMRWMLIYILQATNKIKEYATVLILDRLMYVVFILAIIIGGYENFRLMVIADVLAKFTSLAYAAYLLKEMTLPTLTKVVFNFSEVYENLKAGIKLMFANLASVLMIAIIRFGVERAWDIKMFGKISLTLSAAKLMMVFINAVGIVLYPLLSKMNQNHLSKTYVSIRNLLSPMLLGVLLFYYPVKELLDYWLPSYKEGLVYLVFVFPICFFEGKMALLNNTYLNVLRKEKLLLLANSLALGVSIVLTITFTVFFKSLHLLMASVVVVLAIRSLLAEFWLAKLVNVKVLFDIVLELVLVTIFIYSGWVIQSFYAPIYFAIGYILYLVIKKKDIFSAVSIVKEFRSNKTV